MRLHLPMCALLVALPFLPAEAADAPPSPDIELTKVLDEKNSQEVLVRLMPHEIGQRVRVSVPVRYAITHSPGHSARIDSWLVSVPGEEKPAGQVVWDPIVGNLPDGLGFWVEFTAPETTSTINVTLDHVHWTAEGSGGYQIWRKKRPSRRFYGVRVAPGPWDAWARYLAEEASQGP